MNGAIENAYTNLHVALFTLVDSPHRLA